MSMRLKLKAFTLSEMVVVLILTSIVVGMAFTILNLVQKHMLGVQNNFNSKTQLNKLKQSLWIDFNRYRDIRYDSKNDKLLFASDVDSVAYSFTRQYVVKKVDTFFIDVPIKKFYFDGNLVPSGKIDAIKLLPSNSSNQSTIFVYKSNDATLYMN